MATVSSSNGHQVLLDHGIDDKSRRHPRWTRQETLTLIQSKDITENSPHKGRKMSSLMVGTSSLSENTEPKWVSISSYCKKQGVNRGPAQCRKRWSNLIGDYKKVKAWESKLTDKADSFWIMRNDLRKERKLPVSFDREVFKVLEEREIGSGFAVSPLPLQAVPSVAVSDDTNDYGDGDGDGDGYDDEDGGQEEEEELEEEPEVKPEGMTNAGENVEVEDVVLSENQEDNKSIDNVTESPVKEFCTAEPIQDKTEQQDQAFQNQNRCSSQGAFREAWPGISYWDSQERGKRRRLSTTGQQSNDMEAQIIKVLESNNKMLNAQLDVHNKNCQLEREQRKENNEVLVAALGKLTDALVKIAEKL